MSPQDSTETSLMQGDDSFFWRTNESNSGAATKNAPGLEKRPVWAIRLRCLVGASSNWPIVRTRARLPRSLSVGDHILKDGPALAERV